MPSQQAYGLHQDEVQWIYQWDDMWRDLDRLEKWVNSFIVEQGQVKGPAHRLRQPPVSGQPGD